MNKHESLVISLRRELTKREYVYEVRDETTGIISEYVLIICYPFTVNRHSRKLEFKVFTKENNHAAL